MMVHREMYVAFSYVCAWGSYFGVAHSSALWVEQCVSAAVTTTAAAPHVSLLFLRCSFLGL